MNEAERQQEANVEQIGRRIRRLGLAVAAAALLVPAGVGAPAVMARQEATPAATAAPNPVFPATVTVSGQGTVNVPPDTATVTVGIDVIRPDLAAAQDEAARQATAIIEAVRAQGIEGRDIQTANYSVSILRDYSENGDPTQITGFEVMNQVNVTIRDVAAVGDLLDAVIGAGANSIWGITFFVDDPRPFATEARRLAVEDATEKARQLAEAAGLGLGRVVSIAEGTGMVPPPMPMGRGGGMAADAAMAPPIEAGSSQILVDVSMTFELAETQ